MKIVPWRRRTHEPQTFFWNMEPKTWFALLEDFLRLNCVSPSEWAKVGRHLLCKFSPRLFYLSRTSSRKREAGRKGSNAGGSQAEMTARGYPPVDTGSSSLSDECANSAIADNAQEQKKIATSWNQKTQCPFVLFRKCRLICSSSSWYGGLQDSKSRLKGNSCKENCATQSDTIAKSLEECFISIGEIHDEMPSAFQHLLDQIF
ncbi:hypothetical protein T08_14504 [Trichinella sp. T8]|nr:hypothetical protein T08_14504 [Trichinella sp. T8]